jgi:hypothetical protein
MSELYRCKLKSGSTCSVTNKAIRVCGTDGAILQIPFSIVDSVVQRDESFDLIPFIKIGTESKVFIYRINQTSVTLITKTKKESVELTNIIKKLLIQCTD